MLHIIDRKFNSTSSLLIMSLEQFYPPGAIDETAVNAVKLYCSTDDHVDDGYVESASGPDGDWFGKFLECEQS